MSQQQQNDPHSIIEGQITKLSQFISKLEQKSTLQQSQIRSFSDQIKLLISDAELILQKINQSKNQANKSKASNQSSQSLDTNFTSQLSENSSIVVDNQQQLIEKKQQIQTNQTSQQSQILTKSKTQKIDQSNSQISNVKDKQIQPTVKKVHDQDKIQKIEDDKKTIKQTTGQANGNKTAQAQQRLLHKSMTVVNLKDVLKTEPNDQLKQQQDNLSQSSQKVKQQTKPTLDVKKHVIEKKPDPKKNLIQKNEQVVKKVKPNDKKDEESKNDKQQTHQKNDGSTTSLEQNSSNISDIQVKQPEIKNEVKINSEISSEQQTSNLTNKQESTQSQSQENNTQLNNNHFINQASSQNEVINTLVQNTQIKNQQQDNQPKTNSNEINQNQKFLIDQFYKKQDNDPQLIQDDSDLLNISDLKFSSSEEQKDSSQTVVYDEKTIENQINDYIQNKGFLSQIISNEIQKLSQIERQNFINALEKLIEVYQKQKQSTLEPVTDAKLKSLICFKFTENTLQAITVSKMGFIDDLLSLFKTFHDDTLRIFQLLFLILGKPQAQGDSKQKTEVFKNFLLENQSNFEQLMLDTQTSISSINVFTKMQIEQFIMEFPQIISSKHFDQIDALSAVISYCMHEICQYLGVITLSTLSKDYVDCQYNYQIEKQQYINDKIKEIHEMITKLQLIKQNQL